MKYLKKNFLIHIFILSNCLLFFIFLILRSYPPVFMYLHLLSITAMWGMVLWKLRIYSLLAEKWKETLLVLVLGAISLFVCFYQLEEITPGMYPDEYGNAYWGLELLNKTEMSPYLGGAHNHPTPLLYMTGHSVNVFGHTMTAIRLPTIFFSVLSVVVMYLLMRQFFPSPFAFGGALLLIFQYTFVVLSRLAYEPIPSLFCQLITLLFFTRYIRYKDTFSLVGIALSLGAGVYTYLNFRPFAVILVVVTLWLILKTSRQVKKDGVLFLGVLFASAMPLISFAIIDWHGFWGRVSEISIFGRNYPPIEFAKELWGNIYRTVGFSFIGDPNPGKNPSGVTIFDPITMVFALVGLYYLWIKKYATFLLLLLLCLPPLISDIFSTEVIPEFHYYGLGHPNALRVSGLIPIILFAALYGIYQLYLQWGKEKFAESVTIVGIVIGGICLLNWNWYFNQAANDPIFFAYNYKYNHNNIIKTAKAINTTHAASVVVSKDLLDYGYMDFFLDPRKHLSTVESGSSIIAIQQLMRADVTALAITKESVDTINAVIDPLEKAGYKTRILKDPQNNPDIVIFEK